MEEFCRLVRADPETLSREDLVKRLRNEGRGGTALEDLSREDLIKLARAKLISYEVLFLQVDADAWKQLEAKKLVPIHPPQLEGSWLVEEAQLSSILGSLAKQDAFSLIRAPKVTCFEESEAQVTSGPTSPLVSGSKDLVADQILIKRATLVFDKPYGQKGTEGGLQPPLRARTEFRGKGVRTAHGHRLDTRVVSRLGRDGAPEDGIDPGRDIRSTAAAIEVPLELNCEVPDGSAVVIDSGVRVCLRTKSSPVSKRTVRNLVAVIHGVSSKKPRRPPRSSPFPQPRRSRNSRRPSPRSSPGLSRRRSFMVEYVLLSTDDDAMAG